MTPAHPPPPTNRNFPFHVSGSHTSKAISESGVGFNVAATRQNAGTAKDVGAGGWPAGAGGMLPGGALNVPAGSDSTRVIVVFGREIDFRPVQGVTAAAKSMMAILVIIVPPKWVKPIIEKRGQ